MTSQPPEGSSRPKPLPRITPVNQPFFAALKKRELRLPKCEACGHIFYPPEALCPRCLSRDLSWSLVSGKGKVWSFILMYQRYYPSFAPFPYNIAFVELDEGPWLCTNLVGVANENIRCDMPVEVVFEDVTPEITLAKFRPV